MILLFCVSILKDLRYDKSAALFEENMASASLAI